MVRDINAGKPSSHPSHLTVMDGLLYFQADDGVVGIELWSSDGSTDGTEPVRDINPYTGAFIKAPHGREWQEHATEENR
jgi:ELWxxDGT repeat protein